MTLFAIFLLACLASTTPLQPLQNTPQLFSPTLNLTTITPPSSSSSSSSSPPHLTARAHCFVQPTHAGARTLHPTSPQECYTALNLLLADKSIDVPYTFGRRADAAAAVRLPYASAFLTCKIIIDIMDEMETDRLTWRDIGDALEAPRGVLSSCLGQGRLPPLGGRVSVGKGAMQAIVVGQLAPTAGAVA